MGNKWEKKKNDCLELREKEKAWGKMKLKVLVKPEVKQTATEWAPRTQLQISSEATIIFVKIVHICGILSKWTNGQPTNMVPWPL